MSSETKFFFAKQGGKSSARQRKILHGKIAFSFGKQGGKSSAPAKAVAFCSAKQGGLYVRTLQSQSRREKMAESLG